MANEVIHDNSTNQQKDPLLSIAGYTSILEKYTRDRPILPRTHSWSINLKRKESIIETITMSDDSSLLQQISTNEEEESSSAATKDVLQTETRNRTRTRTIKRSASWPSVRSIHCSTKLYEYCESETAGQKQKDQKQGITATVNQPVNLLVHSRARAASWSPNSSNDWVVSMRPNQWTDETSLESEGSVINFLRSKMNFKSRSDGVTCEVENAKEGNVNCDHVDEIPSTVPLKKRKLRIDGSSYTTSSSSRSSSPGSSESQHCLARVCTKDDDLRLTNLKRLVASCWYYYPHSTALLPRQYYKVDDKRITDHTRGNSKELSLYGSSGTALIPDWLEITKLPPTSGPYVYFDETKVNLTKLIDPQMNQIHSKTERHTCAENETSSTTCLQIYTSPPSMVQTASTSKQQNKEFADEVSDPKRSATSQFALRSAPDFTNQLVLSPASTSIDHHDGAVITSMVPHIQHTNVPTTIVLEDEYIRDEASVAEVTTPHMFKETRTRNSVEMNRSLSTLSSSSSSWRKSIRSLDGSSRSFENLNHQSNKSCPNAIVFGRAFSTTDGFEESSGKQHGDCAPENGHLDDDDVADLELEALLRVHNTASDMGQRMMQDRTSNKMCTVTPSPNPLMSAAGVLFDDVSIQSQRSHQWRMSTNANRDTDSPHRMVYASHSISDSSRLHPEEHEGLNQNAGPGFQPWNPYDRHTHWSVLQNPRTRSQAPSMESYHHYNVSPTLFTNDILDQGRWQPNGNENRGIRSEREYALIRQQQHRSEYRQPMVPPKSQHTQTKKGQDVNRLAYNFIPNDSCMPGYIHQGISGNPPSVQDVMQQLVFPTPQTSPESFVENSPSMVTSVEDVYHPGPSRARHSKSQQEIGNHPNSKREIRWCHAFESDLEPCFQQQHLHVVRAGESSNHQRLVGLRDNVGRPPFEDTQRMNDDFVQYHPSLVASTSCGDHVQRQQSRKPIHSMIGAGYDSSFGPGFRAPPDAQTMSSSTETTPRSNRSAGRSRVPLFSPMQLQNQGVRNRVGQPLIRSEIGSYREGLLSSQSDKYRHERSRPEVRAYMPGTDYGTSGSTSLPPEGQTHHRPPIQRQNRFIRK